MPSRQIRRPVTTSPLAAALVVFLCTSVSVAKAQGQSLTPELQAVRDGLEQYQDPVRAIYDGYLSTVGCIAYPEGGSEGTMNYPAGGMGVHFLNLGYVGPELDPTKPQVLIYEPHGSELRLVAAEWFMPKEVAGGYRPSIFGQELQGPMEGHKPLMPAGMHHYDLHVWLWKNNPAGIFSPTNPAIECPLNAPYTFNEGAPNMVEHGH